jgi:hypothetical protein
MAFARKEVTTQAALLETLTGKEVEQKIVEGVKKYATRSEIWNKSDKNTPFLGQVIGMGIESANLVDVTMSIERQFLTKKTKKTATNPEGTEFRMEDGEVGKLVILEGQDTFVATPGLAVKMLMLGGHMPTDTEYLKDVVSFAYIVVMGEGYKLYDSIQKTITRIEKAPDETSKNDWKTALKEQTHVANNYLETVADPAILAKERMKIYQQEKVKYDAFLAEISTMSSQMESAGNDIEKASLKSKIAGLKSRVVKTKLILSVVEAVAKDCGNRSTLEAERVQKVIELVAKAVASAKKGIA